MDLNHVKNNLPTTPSFVVDERVLVKNLTYLSSLKKQSGCRVLYSTKALPLATVLRLSLHYLDGLSVSSLFEARMAKEIIADNGSIHITTPGLRDQEFDEITDLCSHVSFNSVGQYQRLFNDNARNISVGVRLNPDLSYGDDPRFNPCRPHSKLGLHINDVPDNIDGIHFHTVFSRTDYQPLEEIVNKIERQLGNQLQQLKWINLGGGYLYQKISNHKPFIDVVKQLRQRYALDVYIEPGKAVVGDAAYLVSTVIDRFTSAGKQIAVLDTSVSHHPEVFEYQLSPTLLEANQSGTYACLLVGSSCLAGDVFGEYQFNYLPKIGDRVVFLNVGAYSLIKANRFNGYNLPDVYLLDKDRKLSLIKHSNYQQYHQQWG